MLILYRSLTMYAPRHGPAGVERRLTVWWQPGGLKPGIFRAQMGNGSPVSGDLKTILMWVSERFNITCEESSTLQDEMVTLKDQDPPTAQGTPNPQLVTRCHECHTPVGGPQWGAALCASCASSSRDAVITEGEAVVVCGEHPLPEAGYMRAVERPHGGKAWLRHLKVSGCYVLCPVESFAAGIGVGALRKML